MTHREKLDHFGHYLRQRGFWKSNAMPPAFRLLWSLGFEVPPPYFLPFTQAWVGMGVMFGLPFGLLFPVVAGLPFDLGGRSLVGLLPLVVLVAASSGALFGLWMALWYRRQGKKLDLPPWDEYPRRIGEAEP